MIGAGDPPPTFIQRQIEGLRAAGVEVALLAEPRQHAYLSGKLSENGFVLHLPRTLLAQAEAADLFHFQWPSHLLKYYALVRRFRKPAVLSLRGRQVNIVPLMPGSGGYVRRMRRLMPRLDAYHCVSQDMVAAGEQLGLVASRAWVIRTGVDVNFFTPPCHRAAGPPYRLAMVGALIWRKGYDHALQALHRLVAQGIDASLTIVGAGEEHERVVATIEDLELGDNVVLAGKLGPEGVRQVLQESTLFMHTALSEGIANVTIEAMSCGLPVVTTDAGGAKEAVTDGMEGLVVPVRDVEALARAIKRLLLDERLRTDMGHKARRRAVSEFDIRDQAMRFRTMYASLLGVPDPAGALRRA